MTAMGSGQCTVDNPNWGQTDSVYSYGPNLLRNTHQLTIKDAQKVATTVWDEFKIHFPMCYLISLL